ncbi:MAG: PorT family protein [Bacteroidales bacterium]|nr:PorT family protein [Bacteroidales bacterium]
MNYSYSDPKLYHPGFVIGSNYMDFRIQMKEPYKPEDTLYGLHSTGRIGVTIGMVNNLRLHKYWDLRLVPTISLGARSLQYFLHENAEEITYVDKNIESTTIDIPLEIKWKGMRDGSLRPYVIGGFRYSLDLASNAKKKQQDIDEIVVKLNKNDFLFTTGVGFDFYIPYGNKIALEIKMAFGLNDLLIRENNVFTNGVERLTSKNLQIAITFE